MILPIKKWPDPVLLKPCRPWDFNNPPQGLQRFVEQDLVDTMLNELALGLAANQVGISYRVMAMNVQAGAHAGRQIVMFNPKLLSISQDLFDADEGCLSFPGVMLKISRPKTVEVSWQDMQQNAYTADFTDIDAKCFLHELDHLDGRVFKDYVSELKFQRAVSKAKK
jgi:peptide deformylase